MTGSRCAAPRDCYCRGRRYTCGGCKRFIPFCIGGADETPESTHCDDCWLAARQREAAPPPHHAWSLR